MTVVPGNRRPVDAVLVDLLADVQRLPPEAVRIGAAAGRIAAENVVSPSPLPPVTRAAMDGIAVHAEDTAGATEMAPRVLPRDGVVRAGEPAGKPLPPGTCRGIATGAPLPPGADAVVRVEHTSETAAGVAVTIPVARGTDVRQAGEDAARGDTLVAAGRRLGVTTLAGVAGAGVEDVLVERRPRLTLLPTGDEVVAGTTPDALGPALQHLFAADGAAVTVAGPVRDDADALTRAIATAAAVSDVVVTTGGVSVGPADLALQALRAAGTGTGEHLALRPGKPFAWGRVQQAIVCCLPGNPGAALATAVLLVRPVLAALQGVAAPAPVQACLDEPVTSKAGLRHLLPARWSAERTVVPVPGHGSGDLLRLARADALVDLDAEAAEVPAGTQVRVWPLP